MRSDRDASTEVYDNEAQILIWSSKILCCLTRDSFLIECMEDADTFDTLEPRQSRQRLKLIDDHRVDDV